jgi:hypothetical protein
MPRDPPATSATFPPRSNSLFACIVAPFLDRVHLADGRSAARQARLQAHDLSGESAAS